MSALRAPFPWFGGKSRVADLVWERFGDVRNYVEPFAGSLAVLLARPHPPRVETVNDKDAYLANFWRAVAADPEQVAHYADWPVNEADLHARHRWLVESARERVDRVMSDPDFFDPKVAGWWVWGQCLWIGSGWCDRPEWRGRANAGRRSRGIHTVEWKQRPDLTSPNGRGMTAKRPFLSNEGGGVGVHRPGLDELPQKLRADRGIHASGFHARTCGLFAYMTALSERLRRSRVCCGDWMRVLGPAVTTCIATTGVLLDPPYDGAGTTRSTCYTHDDDAVWLAARDWAVANGDNPELRIALCGYDGEHGIPDTWSCVAWKASGGYGRSARGKANRDRERIWFSPHCLNSAEHQHDLGLEAIV